MATESTDLTSDWTEVTSPLSMDDDSDYLVEVHTDKHTAVVHSYDQDGGATPAADVSFHALTPTSTDVRRRPEGGPGVYSKESGKTLWMRVSAGGGEVVATEIP